jgi:hypothetical protein
MEYGVIFIRKPRCFVNGMLDRFIIMGMTLKEYNMIVPARIVKICAKM